MTTPIYLMLVLQYHQPVGQLDFVNEHSTNVSYLPMIEALERHPRVKVGMHYSGPLLDWLKQNHTDVIERLQVLVERKQVEMLSGGYYEPILAMLPDEDKIGQITKMNVELQETLGGTATGLWLAERVWEPQLPKPIAEAGLRYVVVEDTHFETAGLDKETDLFGYYITEEQGYTIAVFPTLTSLRYTIPWETVPKLMSWLKSQADKPLATSQPKLAFMGDDGEKFGTWPGTFEYCWGDGKYIETLFSALERNSSWVLTATPEEFMEQYPPLGRVYLPSASYREMGEWSLPAGRSHELTKLRMEMEDAHRPDILKFLRGGTWRNFLVKYEESNHLHKRSLMVSEKVHAMRRGRKREQAQDFLWASQGNDPYWHGVFGGIYLFNFRVANYANLIAAEEVAENGDLVMSLCRTDFDRDGFEDLIVVGSPLNAIWNPAKGGALTELDFRPAQYNLNNIMTRRQEGYHADLITAVQNNAVILPDSAGVTDFGTTRGHSPRAVRVKELGLEKLLIYDWHRRASFLDHFVDRHTTLDEFYRARYAEQGDFVDQKYRIIEAVCNNDEAFVHLQREGHVWVGTTYRPLQIDKTFSLKFGEPTMTVNYSLTHPCDEPLYVRFGIETVVGFDGGQNLQYCALRIDDNTERLSLSRMSQWNDISRHAADTTLRNITLRTELSKPALLWQFPLETITLSEAGFERGYQGTVFLHLWEINLEPDQPWQVTIEQTVQQTATR